MPANNSCDSLAATTLPQGLPLFKDTHIFSFENPWVLKESYCDPLSEVIASFRIHKMPA
jgi:hypothetical protein